VEKGSLDLTIVGGLN